MSKKYKILKLSRDKKENIRFQAIKLIKKGYTKTEVSKILETTLTSVCNWRKIYKEKWMNWLKYKKAKGWRPKKEENKLSSYEKRVLVKVLSKEPRETKKLMLDFWLWTIKYVQYAIKLLFWKEMKEWKVRELLHELGFSHKKPVYKAYQQDPEKVEKWIKEELAFIIDESKKENRKIYYWDESGFSSNNSGWYTWWKKWEEVIVKWNGARIKINAISAISPSGNMKFMVYSGNFNSKLLIKFMKQLIKEEKDNITLILDWHPTHKTKKVKEFLEDNKEKIKLYYLPPYSPELNPDEEVWNWTKNNLNKVIVKNKTELIKHVINNLYRLQKLPKHIISFFKKPSVWFNLT